MLGNWKPTLAKLAAIGGLLGGLLTWLAFFGIDAKTIREKMTTHYWFLIIAIVCTAIFLFGIYLWRESSRVTTKNIEHKVRQWTDAFRIPSRVEINDKFYFALVVTLPSKIPVMIRRPKVHPSYLELRTSITTTDKQRELFGKMPEKTQQSVVRAIHLECARAKIESHWHKKLEWVCIHKQIPITHDLTELRLIDGLNEMAFAVAVVGHTITGLIKPPS